MEMIKWFKDIHKEDTDIVGGKGSNLGEMFNIGLPVPGGFCVTASTYKQFIEETKIKDKIMEIVNNIDVDSTEDLQNKAKEIQDLIIATEIPDEIKKVIMDTYAEIGIESDKDITVQDLLDEDEPFVAVRSSATAEDLPEASFAGQQATFLNIRGGEALVNAVRGCWASLFTARAIFYREKNNFEHEKVLIAVVVQKMVDSEIAGVMFSVNPATNDTSEITIEAVYGLGETIVSGSVNPDYYLLDKESLEIKTIELKEQEWGLFRDANGENEKRDISDDKKKAQILDETEIVALSKLGKKIEKHYGMPQDIEWAIEKGKIYIVQSRAVTTLKREKEEDVEIDAEPILEGMTASPGIGVGKVVIVNDISELDKVKEGDVLVTGMTNPDMVQAMKKAAAIVTDEGGMTCHAAIVSREMGIPCVVGTRNATKVLKEGDEITVYATKGKVYEGKVAESKSGINYEKIDDIKTKTKILTIQGMPDYAEQAAKTGAEGVGLLRIEFIIANHGTHPAEYMRENKDEEYADALVEGISKIAEAFKGKTVWVRTSDLRSDEYRNLIGGDKEPTESDPMIGWHGVRRGIDEPRILKAEFLAIKKLHDMGYTNCGIMIPFVIRAEEVKQAKEICREVGLEPCKDVEFGIMVETPGSCWVIEEICKEGIDFASFGTNDLTQLTLGLDRNNERIQKLFDEMHPAVLGEMAMVMDTCHKYGVKTSICGQAGSRPEMAEFLVKHHIGSISANPDAVAKIKKVVAATEKKLGVSVE